MTTDNYRKKPVVVQAVQLTQETVVKVCEFAKVGRLTDGDPQMSISNGQLELFIPTLEGVMKASENDWIVRGVKGELYPVKPDIFEESYEQA